MNTRTEVMLMAARSILENSGPALTNASDALTVAKKVLSTQDLTELTLAALCLHLASFRVSEGTSFHDLAQHVVGRLCKDLDAEVRNGFVATLEALNHVRVRFKHYGDLPNAPTTFPLVERALGVVDDLCERGVGISLRSIDAVAAVEHKQTAMHLRSADALIDSASYKEALVEIGRAVKNAIWQSDLRNFDVGQAESERALLLSGRGVDPASFLEMQRFLPVLYSPHDQEPKFNSRGYGHEANWTETNARFCWRTALNLVLRLQHAEAVPHALDFYEEFEDVIELSEDAKVSRYQGWFLTGESSPTKTYRLQAGVTIRGRATGFLHERDSYEVPLENAHWLRVTSHDFDRASGAAILGIGTDELWLEAAAVTVTYQRNRLALLRDGYRAAALDGGDVE